ncbi:hypothetical protein IKQ26_05275 [bacterium]|nr:hypothetical protein [bacterium]
MADLPYDIYSDWNDVRRQYNLPQYPAGIYEWDKNSHLFALPSTKFPVLALPYDIEDGDGNVLPNGFYVVALSNSRTKLYFSQANRIIAEIPVIKLVEKMVTREEMEKEAHLKAKIIEMKEKKKRKDKIMEKEEELRALQEERLYRAKAEITDSGKGYYEVVYEEGIFKAYGIIKK